MLPGDATEATYSSDLKEWINEVLKTESTPFKEAKVELSKDRKRADILLLDNNSQVVLVIEVKRPEKLPVEVSVRKQAAEYAASYQPTCKQFATHNVNLLVLWDSRTEARIDQFAITYVRELAEYPRNVDEIKESVRKFLLWYTGYLAGAPPTPLDESIVSVVNGFIRGIVGTTDWVSLLAEEYVSKGDFRRSFQQWLVERGWSDPGSSRETLERYCSTLAAQYMYLLVNKILFYNVLR